MFAGTLQLYVCLDLGAKINTWFGDRSAAGEQLFGDSKRAGRLMGP